MNAMFCIAEKYHTPRESAIKIENQRKSELENDRINYYLCSSCLCLILHGPTGLNRIWAAKWRENKKESERGKKSLYPTGPKNKRGANWITRKTVFSYALKFMPEFVFLILIQYHWDVPSGHFVPANITPHIYLVYRCFDAAITYKFYIFHKLTSPLVGVYVRFTESHLSMDTKFQMRGEYEPNKKIEGEEKKNSMK